MRIRAAAAAVALAVAAPGAGGGMPAAGSHRWPGDAPYSIPRDRLDSALTCAPAPGGGERARPREPVVLVHGTGFGARTVWSWNYMQSLPSAGLQTCRVRLPADALADAQESAEYVARAVEVVAARTGARVDVVTHSQGGIVARWAARWFPSGALVDDIVMLAPPNHGTVTADGPAAAGLCFESCWQMRTRSRFLRALNRGDETPGPISYTTVYSTTDELIQPHTSAAIAGASNVHIQGECPGRPVDHVSMLGDGMVYAIALEALTRAGPARPERIPGLCTRTAMPNTTYVPSLELPSWGGGRLATTEPPVAAYARR